MLSPLSFVFHFKNLLNFWKSPLRREGNNRDWLFLTSTCMIDKTLQLVKLREVLFLSGRRYTWSACSCQSNWTVYVWSIIDMVWIEICIIFQILVLNNWLYKKLFTTDFNGTIIKAKNKEHRKFRMCSLSDTEVKHRICPVFKTKLNA